MEEPGTWEADDFDSMYVLTFSYEGGKLVAPVKRRRRATPSEKQKWVSCSWRPWPTSVPPGRQDLALRAEI